MTSLQPHRLDALPIGCPPGSAAPACAWRSRQLCRIAAGVAATRLADADRFGVILPALTQTAPALPRGRARRSKSP